MVPFYCEDSDQWYSDGLLSDLSNYKQCSVQIQVPVSLVVNAIQTVVWLFVKVKLSDGHLKLILHLTIQVFIS